MSGEVSHGDGGASRLRVINLGLPKSGTTTLARALRIAGLATADYRIRRRQVGDAARQGVFVGALLYRGFFETGDPLALMPEFDAFSEISALREGQSLWPQCDYALIAAIRAHHPGARFLLSMRDARELSNSMLRWSNLGTERLPKQDIPGLPAGFGATTAERMTWIEGHHAHVRAIFSGDPALLAYDLADPEAPAKIASHIGRDLPWWGKANVNRGARRSA